MMKKSEAEAAFPELCRRYREARQLPDPDGQHQYSFSDFKSWLDGAGFSNYLKFRSRVSADYEAESWFDDQMKQSWRR